VVLEPLIQLLVLLYLMLVVGVVRVAEHPELAARVVVVTVVV
jgi:hypothetical protein